MNHHNHSTPSSGVVKQGVRSLSRQVGRNVFNLRSTKKMSSKQLSRRAQINREYLERIEMGACTIEFYHIVRIAAAFDMPPEELFLFCNHPDNQSL